jgi:hypothetical protein
MNTNKIIIRGNTLEYWKQNAGEDFISTPISVLKYITILEELLEKTVLSDKEKQEIYISLSTRCGFIETNSISRAKDLERAGQKQRIKVLTTEQMKLIILLEELMERMSADINWSDGDK